MDSKLVALLKGILLSKTMWMNIIAGLAVWLGAHKVITLDPDSQVQLVGGVLVVMNLVLRLITTGSLVDKGSVTPVLVCLLMVGALSACSQAQKAGGSALTGAPSTGIVGDVNAALSSDGAKQGFTLFCVGTQFVLAQVQGISTNQKAGIDEADKIIHTICDAGPPTSALELALSLGKVAVEDQYLRALVVAALGGK